jgi:hypothetical protein
MTRWTIAEQVYNRNHQLLRSNWLADLLALTAWAIKFRVSAIDDERDVSRVQPAADLGAVTIVEAMVQDGSRQAGRVNLMQGISERSGD